MGIISRLQTAARVLIKGNPYPSKTKAVEVKKHGSSAEYWTEHNVTLHHVFNTREESLKFLRWRFDQYPNYENLMPCTGFDNKIILDYGCGPGHDTIGFVEYSKPEKVIAMDVSASSLEETRKRVELHNVTSKVEIKLIKENEKLPLADGSIDYIHSSGVLHHTPNMDEILKEFYRVLKPDGIIRIMVYNSNSIWNHLYVPYILQIKERRFEGLSLKEAFRRSTDGENCPISNNYTPNEYIVICNKAGFKTQFLGAGISLDELDWVNQRNEAMKDIRLNELHRDFLSSLSFDDKLRPIYEGHIAGIDAVFELKK